VRAADTGITDTMATQLREETPAAPTPPPAARRRPSRGRNVLRETLRALSTVLMVAGALLIADAVVTVVWQEPISAYLAQRSQDHLATQLEELQHMGATPPEVHALDAIPTQNRRIAFLARSLRRRSATGSAVGRISIPKIGAHFVVVDGTDAASLRKGPGLYPQTPFPGVPGTTAIAGHRTTYLAPFRHIDSLRPGDAITVTMPYARFTYRVQSTHIVKPDSMPYVIHRTGYSRLALTACHPLYSAAKRIVVFARLATTVPLGSAVRGGLSTKRRPA
jgi:sortase A